MLVLPYVVQGQVGQDVELPDLVEGFPAHVSGFGTR